jgi:putative transposase
MAVRRQIMNLLDATLTAGVKIGNVARWCRDNGVPLRTFYRHRERIRAEGEWRERTRRPHHSPAMTPADLDAWICKLRVELGPDNGADYIRDALIALHARTNPPWRVPSRSTINRVLARRDLLERNPAKRPRGSWRRFTFARPRDCYQIDATFYRLATGDLVAIFEVLDDCSRMLVACHAAAAETAQAAIAAIDRAFTAYGPAALVLCDNGTAFTSRFLHSNAGPSRFAQALHRWGTRLIHASPYHPQTCGKVERHHQTLKRWLAAQPHQPATLRELQRLLDTYRAYYNTRRPHSALHRATPHHVWTTAETHGGPSSLPVQTDATVHRCTVYDTGTISLGKHRMSVGRARYGQTLTAIRDGDHATIYTPDGHPLGHAYLDPTKHYIKLTPDDQISDTCTGTSP